MKRRKVIPRNDKYDRMPQIRQLLREGATVEEIVGFGFPHFEVTKVKIAMREAAENRKPKNTYEKKAKDTERCKGCGNQAIKGTLEHGKCQACVCREFTNYQRRGRWRV